MNTLKATAIAFFIAIGAALLISSAGAQQPSPSSVPTFHAPITLPINPPRGWDPKEWAAIRRDCQTIADKSASRIALSRAEFEEAHFCSVLYPPDPSVTREPYTPQHQFQSSPLPPAPSPQSLNDPPPQIGPFGTPTTGLSGDACIDGQPPDIAADVSPTQIVQLSNFGISVSDKQENVAAGYPVPLATFWAPNSPPTGNFLTDTQIAYDPIAKGGWRQLFP